MRTATVIGVLLLACLAAACARRPAQPAAAPALEAFRAQLDADWSHWMAQYPETATLIGYPGQNARWTDYSQPAIDARAAYLKKSLDRITTIGRDGLPSDQHLNYDLYRDLLQTAVDGLQFGNDAIPFRSVIPHNLMMPINQMEGIQQDIPRVIGAMPASTREDYDNIIVRLEGIAPLIDQTIALMERGMALGLTPPAITLRDVPSQVTGQVVPDPAQSPLLSAFTRMPAGLTGPDQGALRARAVQAYEASVRPAFTKLHEFLTTKYLPACRESVGADALTNGAAMYAYNVRWHTTTALTPKEIHGIGLSEVKRIRGEMDKVIAASGFSGSYAEFVAFLRTDARFYFTDAAALLAAYRDVAKRADPELAHLFGRLPQTPYGVKPVPTAVAPSQTTAYYDQGAFNVGRPGTMFANTYKLEARPKWEMEALTLHEAVPGHHLQISLAQELQGLPEFRKHSSYTAFVEGWALYSESLGEEMGFYADPYSKFGQLTYEMWRAIRLVVDTGLHSMGWTRAQAIEFFATNAAKTQQDITVEVDRYIVWPGQALGYKIGQLKIRELRTSSMRDLDARFDVRAFHDIVLGEGAVPLDVLERRVRGWTAGLTQGQ
ncbi:MAG TPA: DUF885 domain-containing protein [Vicinamibacterales bacterium]|nr:DUF885 domain-containing protein [Vicinamibacterales bacterium]